MCRRTSYIGTLLTLATFVSLWQPGITVLAKTLPIQSGTGYPSPPTWGPRITRRLDPSRRQSHPFSLQADEKRGPEACGRPEIL